MPGKKRVAGVFFFLLFSLLASPLKARATNISDLQVKLNGDDIYVSARLVMDPSLIKDLKAGIEKDLIFYVDVFRKWSSWPDEFIVGRRIERQLKCDNVKGEYMIISDEGGRTRKGVRYANCDDLIQDALAIKNVKVTSAKELIWGKYVVKVSAESRLRNLPPLLGQMFFFLKDKEFKVDMKSPVMRLGSGK
ncbi:MAG: DUF4390 domain-containing protein [Nitrospiraceae bacterium]|nr:DUF4390 domain-containing protein [Nitrospiraceae bacterium]